MGNLFPSKRLLAVIWAYFLFTDNLHFCGLIHALFPIDLCSYQRIIDPQGFRLSLRRDQLKWVTVAQLGANNYFFRPRRSFFSPTGFSNLESHRLLGLGSHCCFFVQHPYGISAPWMSWSMLNPPDICCIQQLRDFSWLRKDSIMDCVMAPGHVKEPFVLS